MFICIFFLKNVIIFLGETPEGVPHKRPASDENEEEEEEEDQGESFFRQIDFKFQKSKSYYYLKYVIFFRPL